MRHSHFPPALPYFIEKKRSYKSIKTLEFLYDKIINKSIIFQPAITANFNPRILRHVRLKEEELERAQQIKTQYDLNIRRLMTQKQIKTEFEIFTNWAMSRPVVKSDYKQQEDLERDFAAIKGHFRSLCESNADRRGQDLDGFVAAMYIVT